MLAQDGGRWPALCQEEGQAALGQGLGGTERAAGIRLGRIARGPGVRGQVWGGFPENTE